jgi:hypothetical protein
LLLNRSRVDLPDSDVGVSTTKVGLGADPTLLILAVSETFPEKPKTPVTVIAAEPVSPGKSGIRLGVTETVKPERLNERTIE